MAVLTTLAAQPGKVVSRDQLMADVWAGLVVSDETLSRCISDLRQALDDDPRIPRFIETLPRRGYRVITPPIPLDPPVAPTPGPTPARQAPATRRAPRRPLQWLAGSLALLLAAAAVWLAVTDAGEPEPAPALLADNGIAVLPFANLSDDPQLEYFSDGLSEEILHRLASVEALAVVARTSSFAFKGSSKDIRQIGRELGVSYVLDGSVRRHGERVRIGAQLIDVRSGFHLFSRVYERPFSDLLAIQEHVAMEVGAALEPRLAGLFEGLQQPAPETLPEALEAYLLGRHLQRKLTVTDLQRAAQEFRRAIALDPGFARAHAGLAEALALTSQYADVPIANVRAEIVTSVETALARDPRCAPAWHARGLLAFYEHRLGDALDAFDTAQSLDPSATGSIGMRAWTLRSLGRNREALDYTALALQNDPINLHAINVHATLLGDLGELEQAERWLRRCMDIDAGYLNAHWGMGYLNWLTGRHAEAVRWYESGIDAGIRQGDAYAELGRVLLELGELERSRQWIDTALARSADPVGQLDGLLAWHHLQGDFAGLAQTVQVYHERFPEHLGMTRYRALAALLSGDPGAAIREYESLAGRDSQPLHSHWDMASGYWHALYLARARQLAGRTRAAQVTLAEAEKRLTRFARETGFPGLVAFHRAAIASLRSDADAAVELLEQARRAGWRREAEVRHSPLFAPIRNDPRLEVVLASVRSALHDERLVLGPPSGSGLAGLAP